MKIATFRINGPLGPIDRFGIVRTDAANSDPIAAARDGKGWVVDVNAAYAAFSAARGKPSPSLRADAFAPADLHTAALLYGPSLDPVREIEDWLAAEWDGIAAARLRGPKGEVLAHRLADVKLMPPIKVPVLRDFAAFEDHLLSTFGKMGLKLPPEWYERPFAFKANPTSIIGHDHDVQWPEYTKKLDFELEIAAVVGLSARNVDAVEAGKHILGYTLLNDFSARDTQRGEMANNTGPFKGKDFAWGLGPWIVTPDEMPDVLNTPMRVLINGEVWAESTPGEMQWSFEEMISYTSQDETVNVGDVIGSGTVNHGCGFELERWISTGDVVELEAAGLGVLRNRITPPRSQKVNWRNIRAAA
ncbi:fumarylacetoacetate hydrolase family protein [Aminobacter sp. AP02]|uniref:fumarylacetoacetate hydrolase family protein n=1 Tax=Aminobacter sp. AP02 TaxID=2135737 RepID=UPI000D6D6378|nr:fumarylacetoacetate hydrolase family protein [Aminobacter sp. AP02]PWK59431.1 2-keto-4-pentenoate hydratase/2-oxohepta-3-ene-1,7-dioic acid hydratase in catechol pathway [Aminobacter sp. AP02]